MIDIPDLINDLISLFMGSKTRGPAVTVIVGSLFVGWFAKKLLHTCPPLPPPLPPPTCDCDHIDRLKAALRSDGGELWQFQNLPIPLDVLRIIHDSGMKVVVMINQKGGVAKSTTTSNLAAFFAGLGKKVLTIDMDYQGSHSAMMLRAADLQIEASTIDNVIITGDGNLISTATSLPGKLSGIKVLTAGRSLNQKESRAFFLWLLEEKPTQDLRFNLARFLASEAVQEQKFDIVLIDTPPRLTTGSINALAAASHFAIPTILDGVSIENVGDLLEQVGDLFKRGLNPHIQLAGIIPTLTDGQTLKDYERQAKDTLLREAREKWDHDAYIFESIIPHKTGISRIAAQELAILTDKDAAQFFENVGRELAVRIGKREWVDPIRMS